MIFKNKKVYFVILLGMVSLFSDMVYEGARSIAGPYLGSMGASGAMIGFIFGFGEFISFALRVFSGRLVDRSAKYWLLTFIGYLCNVIAIPMLALVGYWPLAAFLLIFERIGKALRNPPRDAMLSYASNEMGRGRGFGLHQMLDQFGGVLGPILVTIIFYFTSSFRLALAALIIPGILTIAMLSIAKMTSPKPQIMEEDTIPASKATFPSYFWIYLAGSSFIAAGYIDYPIIAYHFQQVSSVSLLWIPLFYVFAMAMSSVSTYLAGWSYDRMGPLTLMITALFSSIAPILIFSKSFYLSLVGMLIWGIGIGAQRSLLKAITGDMVAKSIRGTAYGIFNMGYGLAWFLGSWLLGYLYDLSTVAIIVFSVSFQLISIPILFYAYRSHVH